MPFRPAVEDDDNNSSPPFHVDDDSVDRSEEQRGKHSTHYVRFGRDGLARHYLVRFDGRSPALANANNDDVLTKMATETHYVRFGRSADFSDPFRSRRAAPNYVRFGRGFVSMTRTGRQPLPRHYVRFGRSGPNLVDGDSVEFGGSDDTKRSAPHYVRFGRGWSEEELNDEDEQDLAGGEKRVSPHYVGFGRSRGGDKRAPNYVRFG